MTAPPPRCPWHRRKRAWAARLLWLAVAYPLSVGPVMYVYYRLGAKSDFASTYCEAACRIAEPIGQRERLVAYANW